MFEQITKPGEEKIVSRKAALGYLGGMLLPLAVGTAFNFVRYFGRTQGRVYINLALILQPCAIAWLMFELVRAYRAGISQRRMQIAIIISVACVFIPEAVKGIFYV